MNAYILTSEEWREFLEITRTHKERIERKIEKIRHNIERHLEEANRFDFLGESDNAEGWREYVEQLRKELAREERNLSGLVKDEQRIMTEIQSL